MYHRFLHNQIKIQPINDRVYQWIISPQVEVTVKAAAVQTLVKDDRSLYRMRVRGSRA